MNGKQKLRKSKEKSQINRKGNSRNCYDVWMGNMGNNIIDRKVTEINKMVNGLNCYNLSIRNMENKTIDRKVTDQQKGQGLELLGCRNKKHRN